MVINAPLIAKQLTARFGPRMSAIIGEKDGYPNVTIRFVDLPPPHGFSITVSVRWRSLSARFILDSFASDVLATMSSASQEKRIAFGVFSDAAKKAGARLGVVLNGINVDPLVGGWPAAPLNSMSLTMETMGVEFNESEPLDTLLLEFCSPFIGMIVSLLPVEQEEPAPVLSETGLPEGAKLRIEVNRYERNRINRQACIAIHGFRCQTCGFDFKQKYGELGNSYIHVHHITPVSKLGEGYLIDPSKDLIPVCANCHSMLHRQDPPLVIEQLRAITGYVPN